MMIFLDILEFSLYITNVKFGPMLLVFISYIENQFKTSVKTIRTDNRVEFVMNNFYAYKGIIYQTTCVGTSEQKDIVDENTNTF